MMQSFWPMRDLMSIKLNNINIGIIGKPNSGKSTLFNCLLKKNISPVGDEYGLTKKLYREKFTFNDQNFTIVDTPGLRRRSKVIERTEIDRNLEVIKLIKNIDTIILLIDSLENITKQDFKLADLVIKENKILFFLFNKIDIIEDKKKFREKLDKMLKKNYDKYSIINIEFISAKKNIKIKSAMNKVIEKRELQSILIKKSKLNKFIEYLDKQGRYPKVKNIEIKPKYIVQITSKTTKFKVFINSKRKTPSIFKKYFDNAFRRYFELNGIPIIYNFVSSKNPYSD